MLMFFVDCVGDLFLLDVFLMYFSFGLCFLNGFLLMGSRWFVFLFGLFFLADFFYVVLGGLEWFLVLVFVGGMVVWSFVDGV